jgi:hypothetical protein
MSTNENRNRSSRLLLLILSLCIATSFLSVAMGAGSPPIPESVEAVAYGGSDCSDFMNGAAVGLGIGALFGCVWCVAGALVAKGIALFC